MMVNIQTQDRPRVATTPALTLTADRTEVKKDEMLSVAVEMAGIEAADLRLEPADIFRVDLTTLGKSGVVRLRGLRDGKATLIATARGADLVRMVHLDCEGPVVRITSFEYIPAPQA